MPSPKPDHETTPAVRPPSFVGILLGDSTLHIAPANCRPPGEIADQDTRATGVWVRADDGPWWKSEVPAEGAALGKLNRVTTAAGGLAKLLAYRKPVRAE